MPINDIADCENILELCNKQKELSLALAALENQLVAYAEKYTQLEYILKDGKLWRISTSPATYKSNSVIFVAYVVEYHAI